MVKSDDWNSHRAILQLHVYLSVLKKLKPTLIVLYIYVNMSFNKP